MSKLYPGKNPQTGYLKRHFLFFIAVFFTQYLLAQPVISSFSPLSGPIGTTVTITGSNFSPTAANNIVYFGAVRATVHSANAGAIIVDVPAGASYQPISVTTNNLTAYSRLPFTVTFAGGGSSFSPSAFGAPKVSGVMGNPPYNTVIGDLNGDGKPDVVAVQLGSSGLNVYANGTSGGTFYFSSINYINVGGTAVTAALADLDGDGKLDLVTTNYTGFYNVSVFGNTSSSSSISFTSPASGYPTGSGASTSYPQAIAITDLDGDGKPDLAIANSDNTITVYQNNSTAGTLSFTNRQDYTIGGGAVSLAAGDLDGDGKPDLISANKSSNTVSILKNTSVPGTISLASKIDYTPGNGPSGVAIADLDGDGKLDFGVVNATDKKLVLFRNTGTTGTMAFTTDTATYSSGTWPPNGIAISDLDGDGKPDVAVSNTDPSSLNLTTTYSVLAFKNTSAPGRVSVAPAASYPVGYSMYAVTLGDLNGDGKPDIVTSDVANHSFAVLLNQIQAPHIHSFIPTSAGTGTTVQINGVALTGITSISFGGTPAQSVTLISDTAITAVVGAGASGSVTIAGSNGTDTLTGFTYIPGAGPQIISFSPVSAGRSDTVMISGTHFSNATAVLFGDVTSPSFTVLTDSSIMAVVGTGASGSVKVTGPGGTDSLAGFTFKTPPPVLPPIIYSFSPTSGGTGTTVTISGTHFSGATAVRFGGTAASSFTVVSDTTITAVVGTGASGLVWVVGAVSHDSLAGFTFLPSLPVHITSFSPTSAGRSDTVMISGTHFSNATQVRFGRVNSASFTILTDSSILAVVGSGASGYVEVNGPGGSDSLAGFTFIDTTTPPKPAPVITSFIPARAGTNDTVGIIGTHFSGATAVRFGGTAASSFAVVSDTFIWAVVGTGASGYVEVNGPGGSDSLAGFTFIDTTTPPKPAPIITSFIPARAGTNDTVGIIGTHFSGATAVRFGGTAASSFAVVSDTFIWAVVGSGASGYVEVNGPGGSDSLAGFTFIDTTTPPPPPPPAVFRLVQFTGSSSANQPLLQWQTMNDRGITYYVVEHSYDSSNFTAVSSVGSQHKDSAVYTFIDPAPRSGVNYYRLKIEDTTGSFTRSNIVGIQLAGAPPVLVEYPNPAVGSITVVPPNILVQSQFQVVDMMGKIIKTIPVSPNVPQVKIDLSGIMEGVYKLIWSDGNTYSFRTILIKR